MPPKNPNNTNQTQETPKETRSSRKKKEIEINLIYIYKEDITFILVCLFWFGVW